VSAPGRAVEHVTCLGCGCACDDITVVVREGRIAETAHACPLGAAWFGDGTVPTETRVRGQPGTLDQALSEAVTILRAAKRPVVYLAGDVSCEVQRDAVAIADRLGAAIDSLAGVAVAGLLAAQRRGRATATLGELRQRADLVVFWGVDPAERYPRYSSRYVVEPVGLDVPEGRRNRRVIAVDVGPSRGPRDADARVTVAPDTEVDALNAIRAAVRGRGGSDPALQTVSALAREMTQGRYVALVADGEPDASARDPDRAEALIALAQALNGPTRCALSMLRGGGNRSGADAVLTWQTGFPFAVDFSPGYPTYRPHAAVAELLSRGEGDTALVIGTPATLPEPVSRALGRATTIAIGPRASAAPFSATVAVDTGVAGIHETGTAFRMDDVPLPLRPPLSGGEGEGEREGRGGGEGVGARAPRSARATVRALRERLA
jgi:formylmethanofuran dehydrogenase subunit B